MTTGILIGSIQPEGLLNEHLVITPYGDPSSPVFDLELGGETYLLIARHGSPPRIPPHMIDHRANIWALKEEGVDAIISICSTGALKPEIVVPGSALPEDYIDMTRFQTFHDDDIYHATPSMDRGLRFEMKEALSSLNIEFKDGGTYIQTQGPRLETRAEVRMLSQFGDYVGMNLASEGALCSELGIPFAGLLSIDNYANGVVEEDLDFRKILRDAKKNWVMVKAFLHALAYTKKTYRERSGE